ncbi:Bug family tripartite tricarboxylate transporter substrate binding protein [Siccirubricoccus phaeus]|uniref:Bug family tripartite tricarboxylate transporter substrate binding protein n=1 Tax=Siccirubricoccus phaeus TaxID=2595053 RepID=UPI0011F370C7|nr:tripartite tricarboxylate transporter substrate-binding protein [Siccirubricoccus phaeus]
MIARRPLLRVAGLALAAPGLARASAWPQRPVTLVIPFPPGGIVDTVGRLMASRAQPLLGQPVLVENRPGAGSALANAYVAQAKPDGYTVLAGGIGLAILPNLQPDLPPADPRRAFLPVAQTTTTAYVLHIHKALPVQSLPEFVAWARAQGPALNAATSGQGTGPHLTWELFRREAGLGGEVLHYRGGVPAILDIQAGRAHFMWGTALEAIQAQRAGQTRPIAITSAARIPALPETPTVSESGWPGFEVNSWSGWYLPAGTPQPVAARLAEVLREVLAGPELRATLTANGVEAAWAPAETLAATLEAETQRWGRLIRQAGITATG